LKFIFSLIKDALNTNKNCDDVKCGEDKLVIDYNILYAVDPDSATNLSLKSAGI